VEVDARRNPALTYPPPEVVQQGPRATAAFLKANAP
jgi:hypothetical protein